MPTGTLVLPAESDVRLGVGYGEDGTEFLGTLAVPVPGAGGLLRYLQMIVAVLREHGLIETVGVEARSTGDSYSASEDWEAHRMPQTGGDVAGLSSNTLTWGLYKIAGQARDPNRLARITDDDGVVWHVRQVRKGFGGYHFQADCVKQIG